MNFKKNNYPRNLRNNNPLNIRHGKNSWKGMSDKQTDPSFVQFETMAYGWRAAFVLLTRTYYRQYALNTPRLIISRWAPDTENDTRAYLDTVCGFSGLGADETLSWPVMKPAQWLKLALAMFYVESGVRDVDFFALMDGWQMAVDGVGRDPDM